MIGMRYKPDQKQHSAERITLAAADLFRTRGYAATGVDAVMTAAQLTAGAFYAHFPSKEKLLAAAIEAAFQQSQQQWPMELGELQGADWVRAFVAFYLSERHRDAPGLGCPMPALAPEVFRSGGPTREVFERQLRNRAEAAEKKLGPGPQARQHALAAIATCVGGLMLSRAVKDSAFSSEILKACREEVVQNSAAAQPQER